MNALSTLASNVAEDAVNAICFHLHDDSPWVQCAAISTKPFLAPIRCSVLPYLPPYLPQSWIRFAAVCALSVWSERGVCALSKESWIQLSTDQDPWVSDVAKRRLEASHEHAEASGNSYTGWSAKMAKSLVSYRLSLIDGGLRLEKF